MTAVETDCHEAPILKPSHGHGHRRASWPSARRESAAAPAEPPSQLPTAAAQSRRVARCARSGRCTRRGSHWWGDSRGPCGGRRSVHALQLPAEGFSARRGCRAWRDGRGWRSAARRPSGRFRGSIARRRRTSRGRRPMANRQGRVGCAPARVARNVLRHAGSTSGRCALCRIVERSGCSLGTSEGALLRIDHGACPLALFVGMRYRGTCQA